MTTSRKFKSSTGSPTRVITENLDVALVGTDWTVLPERFHLAAYAAGCISDDMIRNTVEERVNPNIVSTLNKVANKNDQIKTIILSWLAENKLDKFYNNRGKSDWRPKAAEVTKELGQRAFKQDVDSVWYKLLEEGIDLPEFE